MTKISRRNAIAVTAGMGTSLALGKVATAGEIAKAELAVPQKFRFCFNTSTIRGQKLPLDKLVNLVADAGYDGIEPWIGEITRFKNTGRKLKELADLIKDRGLKVESAIGFANWIVDDKTKREKALDQAKRDMEVLKAIGGTRIAAPPAGTSEPVDLARAAERYRELLKIGEQMEVLPQLELWGFSQPINRLGELAYIAAEAGHPNACILPDIYHIYKGGSDFAGLKMLNGGQIHVFHVNDYPDIAREKIKDSDRVYPGDGVAPIKSIVETLNEIGFQGALSLELFNPKYWKLEPAEVAKVGLEKMKKAVSIN